MTDEGAVLGTSHVHGCEHPGCPQVGAWCQVWVGGHGYLSRHLCNDHSASEETAR